MPTFDWSRFFLEQAPRAAFLGAATPFGTSPLRRRFLGGQFDEGQRQYESMLGQQALRGELPEQPQLFSDFVRGLAFNQLFQQQPRFQRGVHSSFFNPRTRFLFGF